MSIATETRDVELRDKTLWGMLEEVAARHPDKEALVGVDTDGREVRMSYGELVRQARVMSAVFAQLGVRRGDRVALWMTNLPQWIPAHFGLMRLGAVSVAVSTWLKPEEIKYFLGHSRARHLLMLDRFRPIQGVVRWCANGSAGIAFNQVIPFHELMAWLRPDPGERRQGAGAGA